MTGGEQIKPCFPVRLVVFFFFCLGGIEEATLGTLNLQFMAGKAKKFRV